MTEQEIVKALRCNKGCRYGSDVPIECRARYGGVPICPKESAVEEAPRVIERLSAEVERLQAQLSEEKTDATLYSDRLEEEQEYVRKLEAEVERLTRERDAPRRGR